ncbi:MAG: hypothetical protein RR303_07990 [Bacteroidales bacterium]
MKYNLSITIGTECKNSNIHHIWVLDADNSNYFNWNDSSLPKIHKITDSQRITIAAAADGLFNGYAGICVFPSASATLESLSSLYEINRNHIPLFVICFIDEYDMLAESIFYSLLRASNFFVRSVTNQDRVDFRIANSLQYAIAEKQVSILLIDRKLNLDNTYEKCWRYKVHHTQPIVLPPDNAIQELAALINQTNKITILCGESCGDAVGELLALAGLIKSPLSYTPAIRKKLHGKTEYEVGIYGKWSEKSAIKAIREAELILLFDYSETDFRSYPSNPMIIQVTPFQLNGLDADQRKRIYQGDIKETLQKLLPFIQEKADSSFADTLSDGYKQDQANLDSSLQQNPDLFNKLVYLWNEHLERETIVCSYGYHSYILKNLFLNAVSRKEINLSNSLLSQGGVLYEAIGLNGGDKKKPVFVFMDGNALYNELSSLIPLTTLDYPVKLCILNTTSTSAGYRQTFSYQEAAECMQIPYFSLNEALSAENVIKEWLSTEGGAILEITGISFPENLFEETHKPFIPLVSELFEQLLYDTFEKLHTGKCFYYQPLHFPIKFHSEALGKYMIPIYNPRSVFYAAAGASNASDDIPVCVATSLSDVLQMLPGIREARRNHIPILFFVILTNPLDISSRNELLVLHKIIHLISSYHYLADDPQKDLGLIVGEAIAEAQYLNGIATVIFDPNIYQSKELFCSEIFDSPYVESIVYPNEEELDRIAKVINYSKNTVIFAGAGCRRAHREVMELARKLKAPLGWTYRAKDEFDHDNYYPIGMAGLLSNPGLEEAFKKCEVLILLGTNLNLNTKISKTCQIVQIDINPYTLGIPHPVDIGIVGDIRMTLKKLLPMLVTIGHNSFAERCSRLYEEEREHYDQDIRNKAKLQEGILMESVSLELNKLVAQDAWVIADMIIPWYLSALNIQSNGSRRLFATGESIYTCNSSGFAVGVQAMRSDLPAIVLATDITFIQQLDNLVKLVQSQQNVKIFVMHIGANSPRVEYSKFRLSTHAIGLTIDKYEDLHKKMEIALTLAGPVIVDIPVMQQELIKSPPFLPVLAQKYNMILRKLYQDSEKEEMLQTMGNTKSLPLSDE